MQLLSGENEAALVPPVILLPSFLVREACVGVLVGGAVFLLSGVQ